MKRTLKYINITVIWFFLFLSIGQEASATMINFDAQGLTGPSAFAVNGFQAKEESIKVSTTDYIKFDNGMILNNTATLYADETSVYGTCKNCGEVSTQHPPSTLGNPLQITFPWNIKNLFLDVYNGMSQDTQYKMWDNAGNSSIFTLAPNLNGGAAQIGFAAAGSEVSIAALTSGTTATTRWNFYIDNIHYDEPLPGDPSALPESATVILLGTGLLGMGLMRKKFTKQDVNS